jgi:predicted metal-binding protein
MGATLHVCTTCRAGLAPEEGEPRPGARLHAALSAQPTPAGVRIRPVECLSACGKGPAIALSAPGSWSYIHGPLQPEDAAAILAFAAAYAAAPEGIVPWRERPALFRKHVIARLPPQEPRE